MSKPNPENTVKVDGIAEAFRTYFEPYRALDPEHKTTAAFHEAIEKVFQSVKLIIWDLDNTFWRGILAEGSMEYDQHNHDLVIGLARRGIISSICSSNDFSIADAALQEHGIRDYFVFPKISWEPKSKMVFEIIHEMQLRPKNVLFVDDLPRLLEEVMFFNEGVYAVLPEFLKAVHLNEWRQGEVDKKLTRLMQYKMLEKKAKDEKSSTLNHEDFLRASQIVASVITSVESHRDRIVELVNRTNQLNYTKIRFKEGDFERLVADKSLETRCICVQDAYGDYGVVGFYSLDRSQNKLLQFVFSCRILNMGIENYFFHLLGRPQVDIRGDVSTPLGEGSTPPPDWIKLKEDSARPSAKETLQPSERSSGTSFQIILKGGCDLEALTTFLASSSHIQSTITTEFHYITEKGGLNLWQEHLEILRHAARADVTEKFKAVLQKIPWLDAKTFNTRFLSAGFDVYIFSALQDYGCGIYRYQDTELIIPADYFGCDLTDPKTRKTILGEAWKARYSDFKMDAEFLDWFRSHFRFEGPESEERFGENVKWLASCVPQSSLLLILNGAEIDPGAQPYPFDSSQLERHRRMNAVLDKLTPELPNTRLLDVRRHIQSRADLGDRLFHYKRPIYSRIAADVVQAILRKPPGRSVVERSESAK